MQKVVTGVLLVCVLGSPSWALAKNRGEGGHENPTGTAPTRTCPPDTWPYAAPHHDFKTGVTGTLVCNTVWPRSLCPCKKCTTIKMGYADGIFNHLFPPPWSKKKYKRDDYNEAEKWVTDNSCAKETSESAPPASPSLPVSAAFVRPTMNVGDQQDCELLSSKTDPELGALCESQLQVKIGEAGRCAGYFEKRARQGGLGYDGGGQAALNEQNGPRICEFLIASDALTEVQRADRTRSQALDRRPASDQDVQECRNLVQQDARENRYCFKKLNQMIQAERKCHYYFAARFRQGNTCPTAGQRTNTFQPKTQTAPSTQ